MCLKPGKDLPDGSSMANCAVVRIMPGFADDVREFASCHVGYLEETFYRFARSPFPSSPRALSGTQRNVVKTRDQPIDRG